MYEALKQTQNKNFVLFWVCFGFVLRCFVSVVRAALGLVSLVLCQEIG